MTAYVYDGSSRDEVQVMACSSYYNVPGGSCGSAVGSGPSYLGYKALAVPFADWTSAQPDDFLYLWTTLPPLAQNLSYYKGMLVQ